MLRSGLRQTRSQVRIACSLAAFPCRFAAFLITLSIAVFAGEAIADAPDSLDVRFQDGRPTLRLPVHHVENGDYLALADVGRITGQTWVWDPETYRGSFQMDSTTVGFVLDAPLVWLGSEVLQVEAPVVYHEEQVLVPYSLVDLLIVSELGSRASFEERSGRLEIGGPQPWLHNIRLERDGRRLRLVTSPLPRDRHIRWDPRGTLSVQMLGVHLPPAYQAPNLSTRGVDRVDVLPTPGGLELRLHLDPGWVGMRAVQSPSDAFQIELTQSLRDVEDGRFDLLTSYLMPESDMGRKPWKVLLEVSAPPMSDGGRYLEELANELGRVLESTFGHDVEFVPDRAAADRARGGGVPELPGVPPGNCWVGFRLESYSSPDARGFLLVTPGQSPHFDAVGGSTRIAGAPAPGNDVVFAPGSTDGSEVDQGLRLVPWGQAPRLFRNASEGLARSMADHVQSDLPLLPVQRVARPARVFRGIAMPAVLIYPALANDESSLRALAQRDQVELLSKSLAHGIDEFLREQSSR